MKGPQMDPWCIPVAEVYFKPRQVKRPEERYGNEA